MKRLLAQYQKLSVQVKASIWFLICGFLQKGISLITTPIFTRIMSQVEYGQFSVYLSWFSILSIFLTLNLSYGVYLQGLVKYENDKDVYTSSLLGLTTIIEVVALLIFLAFHRFFSHLLDDLPTSIIVCMIISTWTEAVFSFWSGRQRNDFKYISLVALSFGVAIAKPLIAVILILLFPGHGLEARVYSMTIIEIIAYSVIFVSQMRKGKTVYHKFYWKYAVKFNIPLIPHYLSQTVLSSCDRIMISSMCSQAAVAVYSLAHSIGMIMTIVNTALSNAFTPWVYQQIKKEKYDKIGTYSYYLIILVAVANLMLIALAPEVIMLFAPPSYYDGIWLIPPIALGTYFMFMYNVFANFSFYFEKTKAVSAASSIGAVLNVVLNYIFIKIFGYVAAAYTTFICYLLYAIAHYGFMRLSCKKNIETGSSKIFDPKIIVLISLIYMVLAFGMMSLYSFRVVRLLIIAAAFAVLFICRKKIISLYSYMRRK